MINVTDEEIQALTAAIMKRHGVDFTSYEPKSLKRRIIRALSVFKLGSIHELWVKILKEKEFVSPFVNELSVGLTSMFRDPGFWRYLRELLPEIIDRKGTINIWHAGCSTGEEVFSLGILLRELGLADKAKSLATDMNTDSLINAQQGKFHIMKLKDYNKNYIKFTNEKGDLSKYYQEEGNYGQMDLSLIENVKFKESNLITDTNFGLYDIIFCRNVMIYFDAGAKKVVLNKFHKNLTLEGLLIIGYFDALVPLVDKEKFQFHNIHQKVIKKIA